jgi:4,4'-diaponeurosporenoate glycosyltransferase
VQATRAPVVVFLDADVTPEVPDLLDRVASLVDADDVLVSVQPFHRTRAAYEQLSLLFNISAVMGSAACTPLGDRVRAGVSFGPVLACTRAGYLARGGHAHPDVRGAVAEDIALARRFGDVRIRTGRGSVSFRMYPDGPRALVQGWTKNIATGAAAIRWWFGLAVAGWIWSLAGGWLASPWFYAASLGQLAVLGRRVGRFRWWAYPTYPGLLVVFLAVFLRSVALTALGREVSWKGRRVASRRTRR